MSLLQDISVEHLRVSSLLACFSKGEAVPAAIINGLPEGCEHLASDDKRSHIVFRRRVAQRIDQDEARPASSSLLMVLGDDWEWAAGFGSRPMANATAIACRLNEGRLEALTAIPGLPPLYLLETATHAILTTDLYLLKFVAGLSLRFDPDGLLDLARIGRPVAHRTLFSGVRLLPGGSRVVMDVSQSVAVQQAWDPPAPEPCADWDEYTALQAEAFARAASGLDYDDCVLSLTAGLDTRAILAGLIANDASVPALTVTGETQCLDARTASRLCAIYGMNHRTMALDGAFCQALPELADRASLLSGGISSVGHAGQVYCYSLLGNPPPDKMLSGYLGNQLGRLGTEGLTTRRADMSFLNAGLVERSASLPAPESWYTDAMEHHGHLERRFLIQQESMFGNLASYGIGNSHSVQQSTYGFRALIENLWRMPAFSPEAERGSARLHDMKHRFFGEPLAQSFQRRYINRVGGAVAEYPVNWGWRSRGGVSLSGLFWGGLAFVDAVVSSRFAQTPAMGIIRGLGIAGLHEYRPVHQWMHAHLKEFIYDVLLSRGSADSGLFDNARLTRRLHEYYSGGSEGYGDILYALDVALAAKNFGATI